MELLNQNLIVPVSNIYWNRKLIGRIKQLKDETVTSTGFTNASPQRKVLFLDRVTGQDNNFEGVITKVIYDQTINTTSIKTSVMETSIETRILKVGDLIIIKEEQILYKGSRYQHIFIFLTIDLTKTYGQLLGMRFYPNGKHIIDLYHVDLLNDKIVTLLAYGT